jgi:hypothetical protein
VGKWASLFTKMTGQGGGPWVASLEKAPPLVFSGGITGNMVTDEEYGPVGVIGTVMDATMARRGAAEGGGMP